MSEQAITQSTSTWTIDRITGDWATLTPGASVIGFSEESPSGDTQLGDTRELNLPVTLLPSGASEGDVVHLTLSVDVEQTERARAEVSALFDELTAGDDGADFDL